MIKGDVSLYSLFKEMFEEEGNVRKKSQDGKEIDFGNYYREKRKRLMKIFKVLGADPLSLKDIQKDKYRIPLKQKDNIKKMLQEYTSKKMKLIRKEKFDEIPAEELGRIVAMVEGILKERLGNDERYEEQRTCVYLKTRYPVLKNIEEVRKMVLERIVQDMEDMKPVILDNTLQDMDKVYLLRYYRNLLEEASQQWREVVQNVSDLRTLEIADISLAMTEGGIKEETDLQQLMDESPVIIWKAVDMYRNDVETGFDNISKRPSSEELERTKKLIEAYVMKKQFEIDSFKNSSVGD